MLRFKVWHSDKLLVDSSHIIAAMTCCQYTSSLSANQKREQFRNVGTDNIDNKKDTKQDHFCVLI